MSMDTPSSVRLQTSAEPIPSMPAWFGEVALIAHTCTRLGLLAEISEQVRFARKRFGTFEVLDFVVVLLGYAISGEPTLAAYYERLQPFATPFMALFGRDRLPSRSALSRFLAALDQASVEALRSVFLQDALARPGPAEGVGGLWDRQGHRWVVFDLDGTRQAARQRALPQGPDLPPPQRRLQGVCAPGYTGRKRGEVVRTRTTLLQAHTHQWLGTFGKAGNGDYRGELRRGLEVIAAYQAKLGLPVGQALIRLDGQYGDGAIIADLLPTQIPWLMRGKDYGLLDLAQVKARLALPADEQFVYAESGICRDLFDCGDLPVTAEGHRSRVIIATHPAGATASPIGVTREGVVYELFFTALPALGFTAADVVRLYLHRGSFETVLADEDREQDSDRWSSYTPCGQEAWQILAQWSWNLRQELSHQWHPTSMRLTEFAPPHPEARLSPDRSSAGPAFGPPQWARASASRKPGRATTFFLSQMARCGVGTGPPCIRRNDAPSMMGRCACFMPPASLTVAPVPCASTVKDMASRLKNRVGSALSCIPCHSQRQNTLRLPVCLLRIPSCGGIGPALSRAAPGYGGSAATWSRWKPCPFPHLPPRLHRSHARCARIGA